MDTLVVELDEDASEFRDWMERVGDAGIGLDVVRQRPSSLVVESLGRCGNGLAEICIGCNENDLGGTGRGRSCGGKI